MADIDRTQSSGERLAFRNLKKRARFAANEACGNGRGRKIQKGRNGRGRKTTVKGWWKRKVNPFFHLGVLSQVLVIRVPTKNTRKERTRKCGSCSVRYCFWTSVTRHDGGWGYPLKCHRQASRHAILFGKASVGHASRFAKIWRWNQQKASRYLFSTFRASWLFEENWR
jgi:hypothetical protein